MKISKIKNIKDIFDVKNKKSLWETHKKLVEKEWDYEKNNKLGLDPNELTKGSNKKAWWICFKCKSSYDATIANRTNGRGCSYCTSRKVNYTNCLSTTHPEKCRKWDYEKNNGKKIKRNEKLVDLIPENVTCGMDINIWWRCAICNSSYEKRIGHEINSRNGCSYCSGHKVNDTNCVSTTHPQLLEEWDFEKNSKLGLYPEKLTKGSNKKVWLKCLKCKSSYDSTISNRTYGGNGCPFCSGQKVNDTNCLSTTHSQLLEEWDFEKNSKLGLDPNKITYGSRKKVWWICLKCKSSYDSTIGNRIWGCGCSYCSGHKVNDTNCLSITHPQLLEEWDFEKNSKLGLDPNKLTKGSEKRVWWKCLKYKDHRWKSVMYSKKINGGDCPYCKFKGERKIYLIIKEVFNDDWEITKHYRIWNSYKDYNHKRSCDFFLEKNNIKIMIERDGEQHFMSVRFGGRSQEKAEENFIRQQLIDKLDAEFCKENNIILHRIGYNDDPEESIYSLKKKIDKL
jgi:hypothetical protein